MNARFGQARQRQSLGQYTGQWKLAAAEYLEARQLLAGDVLIAELVDEPVPFGADCSFVASMDIQSPSGLRDRDGSGGQGMTLVLQAAGKDRLGNGEGGLGLDGLGSSFVAIEYDTLSSDAFDPDESLPTHIGIDTSRDVDSADVTSWLAIGGIANIGRPYVPGDADLDGDVDVSDFNSLGVRWQVGDASWGDGDFTGDGSVTAADLNALALNWRHGVPAARAPLRALRTPRAPLPVTRASFPEPLPTVDSLASTRGERGDNSMHGSVNENVADSVNDEPDFYTPVDPNRGLPIDKNPANENEWMFLELVDDVLARWPDSP